jgi:thiosulfate/3-mercaptopyruvate sulfurtransferase
MKPLRRNFLFFVAAAALVAAPASGQRPLPPESLVVSTEWVANRLAAKDLVILEVRFTRKGEVGFAGGHIPGAQHVDYDAIVAEVGGLAAELPPTDSMRSFFEARGVSDRSRVVIYSEDPIQAARAFWLLDHLGQTHVSIMSGGSQAWRKEGRPIEKGEAQKVERGKITTKTRDVVVPADYVKARLGRPGFRFLDTRTIEEYTGSGGRRGIPSEGHLQGAKLLLWEMLVDEAADMRFRPPEMLDAIYQQAGVAPGDTVVTYCFIGFRASLSYFVARYLGYPVKIYDGSYQDWIARKLPVVKDSTGG